VRQYNARIAATLLPFYSNWAFLKEQMERKAAKVAKNLKEIRPSSGEAWVRISDFSKNVKVSRFFANLRSRSVVAAPLR
jgi:hypothetical protein